MRAARGSVAAVTVAVMICAGGAAHGQVPAVDVDPLQALTQVGVDGRYPGLIGAVRVDDENRYARMGFGDLWARIPADTSAQFRIGSITKTFVATVMLQLEGEGKLSLDDTVEHWLPGLVPGGDLITVRQLLNHTAGLNEYTNDPAVQAAILTDIDTGQSFTPRQLVDIALAMPSLAAPGERFIYTNTAYILAGMVITAVTGHTPGTEVADRIVAPLRLQHTSFPVQDRQLHGNWLHGYMYGRDVSFVDPGIGGAAFAMVSTLDDLMVFTTALVTGRLLPPAQMREMSMMVPLHKPGNGYGLGIEILTTDCGPVWVTLGGVLGYASGVLVSIDGTRQLAFAANEYRLDLNLEPDPSLLLAAESSYCQLGQHGGL
ncbi:serine hydrolase domain-containing protein [Nocardia sp. NPDC052001]|uniref:serine hydrolase domain-containing protein n=1 Tax=Nocardia sp. NPDC052001 TaxID=3154853 RepID=UPI00343DC69A